MRNRKRPATDEPQSLLLVEVKECCRFQNLPRRLVMDILSRLPVKTLFHCRSVCKNWYHVISDPQFVKLHLARSPVSVLIKTMPPTRESRQFQLAQPLFEGHDSRFLGGSKMKFSSKSNLPDGEVRLINSCNGFVCLAGPKESDPISVCNPVLGEYITLPSAANGRRTGTFLGIGFSHLSGQYKVVQTFHPMLESLTNTNFQEAKIYTLGSGVWRNAGYAPYRVVTMPFYSYLNGALHWVPCIPNSPEFIYSFDFNNEQFGVIPPPPHFGKKEKELTDYLRVGVLKGCLYICLLDRRDRFDIWVMKDYGNQESWTKQFVIENLVYPRKRSWDFYEPIMVLNNGEILMLYNDDAAVCYTPSANRVRNYRLSRTRSPFHAIGYAPCFLSLSDVAKGEQVTRLQSTKLYDKLFAEGIYSCGGCGTPLYKTTKFNSGIGHSDHYEPFPGAVVHAPGPDGRRIQTICATCGGDFGLCFSR